MPSVPGPGALRSPSQAPKYPCAGASLSSRTRLQDETRRCAPVDLHHEDLPGADPPFLLLHGILDAMDAWRPVAARLHAAGHRVLLLDDRGHGRSPAWRPGMDWSPMAVARDAAALLDRLGVRGAHVVGHSRGATAAGWLAVERPDLTLTLTAVASPPQASEAFRAAFRRRAPRDEREAEAFRYLSEIPEDDFPAYALRAHRGPALVVEAEDDPLYSPTGTLFWRAFLPYAELERVPGGHRFFVEEAGAEWLAGRLRRFAAAPLRA